MKRSICLMLLGLGCATSSSKDNMASKVDGYFLRKQLARSLVEHREWASAAQPLLELRAIHPQDADVHCLLGTVYREQGLLEESEGEYQAAIRHNARLADAHAGLAMVRVLRGDSGPAAVAGLKSAIALSPEQASYYNNLGFALYLQGSYTEAVVAYREGLRRDPQAHRTRNNLGFAYGRLGHLNRARREFERAGSPAEVQNNLGYVLEQNGDREAACKCYDEARRLAPTWRIASVNYSRVCEKEAAMNAAAPTMVGRIP